MLILKLAHVNKWVFASTVAVTLAIPALVYGTAAWPILMWIFFMILPANWMVSGYKRSASAKLPLTYGTLGVLVMFFLIFIAALNMYPNAWANLTSDIKQQLQMMNGKAGLNFTAKQIAVLTNNAIQIIPAVFVIFALGLVGLIHTIVRRIFKLNRILLPELKFADEWRVPKSWVLLFVAAFVVQSIIKPGDNSFLVLAANNLVPILLLAFTVQAFGFFHVVSQVSKWGTAFKVIGAIMVLPMTWLVAIVGIIDTLFPLRERFTKQEG